MKNALGRALITLTIIATPVEAQNEQEELTDFLTSAFQIQTIEQRFLDPTQTAKTSTPVPSLTLNATSKDSIAALRIGGNLATAIPKLNYFDWFAQLSTPLNENKPRTTLATFDALPGNRSLELGISWTNKKKKAQEKAQIVARQIMAIQSNSDAASLVEISPGSSIPEETKETLIDAFLGPQISGAPGRERDRRLAASLNPASIDLGSAEVDEAVWYIGLSGKGGLKKYEYASEATFSKEEESLTSTVGTLSIGKQWPQKSLYLGLTASAKDFYEEHDPVNICTPVPSSPLSTCEELALGHPDSKSSETLGVEMHHMFAPNFGLVPRIAYDLEDEKTTFQLPLFFILDRSDEPKLNGGIAVQWNSKTEDWEVSVFVGEITNIPKALR